MDSPTALALAIRDQLEDGDDLVPVRWWLEQLAQAELEPAAASKVVDLGDVIASLLATASELVQLVGPGEKTA